MPTLDELRGVIAHRKYVYDSHLMDMPVNWENIAAMVSGIADAQNEYIDALEADHTAQQQRIEKLEAALEPFAVRYPTEHMDLMPDLDKWTPVYQWVDKPSELLPGTPVIYIGEFRDVNAVYPYTPSWRKPDDADDDRRE